MKAGLAGDAAAYGLLLFGLTPHLRAYFHNRLAPVGRSARQVEDLVQATLMTIHSRRNTYARQRALSLWICAKASYWLLSRCAKPAGRWPASPSMTPAIYRMAMGMSPKAQLGGKHVSVFEKAIADVASTGGYSRSRARQD